MAVFKCKMCGGDLNIDADINVVECEYCGTTQTVPTADNEKKMSLFARANKLRAACDFDKAAGIYESIVTEFPEEAEGYWGLILCKYGIEYVDDPASGKKIPTCHRSSFDCILDDSDFEMVMENADSVARKVYRDEAKAIEELRKAIIEISGKEEPYDIFICYKETAENGDRTIDSVIAQDVYDELTAKGYRVFFSRITLEDKLGQEYEPYIFAALNSAKVMLAFGTDYEYYNAVWVKNEWSRFLQLISKGEKKTLIPCYKNIDAYDMPKEFAKLQAQDMGKVGAVQDLLRGIEKILPKNEPAQVKETVVVNNGGPNVQALLTRGNNALEDGNFVEAKTHFDKVLDIDAECAEAYLGLAMATENVCNIEDLIRKNMFNGDYQRAKQYARAELAEQIKSIEIKYTAINEKKKADIAEHRKKILPIMNLIGAGKEHSVALDTNGVIRTTKYTGEFYDNQADVREWTDIIAVAAGEAHTVGLKKDGTVIATKSRFHNAGQSDVTNWKDIIAVSCGQSHTVGLKADGTVIATKYTLDYSYCGQCDVKDWTDIIAVAAGSYHTVGLKADGTVVATKYLGQYYEGQCDVTNWKDIIAVSCGGGHTVGLKADGTVVATGHNKAGQCEVNDWTDIIAVAAGEAHTVGLKKDGTVIATIFSGNYYYGRCDVENWTDIVAISAGYNHTICVDKNGKVFSTQFPKKVSARDYSGQCAVAGWKIFDNFEKIHEEIEAKEEARKRKKEEERKRKEEAEKIQKEETEKAKIRFAQLRKKLAPFNDLIKACSNRTIGLCADGTVLSTMYRGSQEFNLGQCDVGHFDDIIAIYGDWTHTVGLRSDGTLIATQYKGNPKYNSGQCNVADWKNIIKVVAGGKHTIGLKADGSLVCVGDNENGQCNVAGWTDIVDISGGARQTVGLKSDGTVVATKYIGDQKYNYGQGNVSDWKDIVSVIATAVYTVGLKSDGTVVATGDNEYRQCKVSDWTNIVSVATSGRHTIGLCADGTVVATGGNYWKQCNVAKWKNIISVVCGDYHTVGLKEDGTVVATGDNDCGQCNVSAWKDIVAVSAGKYHTIGLKSNGVVVSTKYVGESGYYHGECDIDDWKLFDNIDNFSEEREKKMAEKRKLIAEKKRIAAQKAEYRSKGVCQHCGGTFKGLFTKKCVNCGKEKDY